MQSNHKNKEPATANGELSKQPMPYFNSTRNYTMGLKCTPDDIKRIAFALGKAKGYRNGFTSCCPAHHDNEPSLEISISDKYPLGLYCYAGCNPKNIYDAIRARGLIPHNQAIGQPDKTAKKLGDIINKCILPKLTPNPSNTYNQKQSKKLWQMSIAAEGTLVETYLRARSIQCDMPSTIRYVPSVKHTPTDTYLPCMIAIVTRWPGKEPVAIHRTYLAPDGSCKADIKPNKMMLGAVAGGAVRLTEMKNVLIMAEGIETALSFMESDPGHAIWAVLSASNFQSLVLPELPLASIVIIAADNDKAGINAAKRSARKWTEEGRVVKIAIPPKDMDFNDVLKRN
ncbi:MAG: toprim domain-containing protein [Pseudomonadota bacterium]